MYLQLAVEINFLLDNKYISNQIYPLLSCQSEDTWTYSIGVCVAACVSLPSVRAEMGVQVCA